MTEPKAVELMEKWKARIAEIQRLGGPGLDPPDDAEIYAIELCMEDLKEAFDPSKLDKELADL